MLNNDKDETKHTLDPVKQLRNAYEQRWKALAKRSEKLGLSLPDKEQLWKKVLNQWNNGFKCEYCNDQMKIKQPQPASKTFTLEHSIALYNGGNNAIENIHVICKECNTQKNVMTPELFNQLLTGNKKKIPGLSPMLCEFFKINDDGWSSGYLPITMLLQHLSRRSKSSATRRNYLHHIRNFCLWLRVQPDELTQMPKQKAEQLIQKYADSYNNDNYSRRTINSIITTLKTLYQVNGYRGSHQLNIEIYYTPKRYRKTKEYIPQKHEVYLMADNAGSLRDRAVILSIFSSGIRNSTLRAILYKDIKKELLQGLSIIRVPIYPEMKDVDPDACKNGIPYYVFFCEEAVEAIRLYLQNRAEKYGPIEDNDPLFSSECRQIKKKNRPHKPLTSSQIQNIVKKAAKHSGLKKWKYVNPRCLRKSFESVLRHKTHDNTRLDLRVAEFFMGHILENAMENYFDSTKIDELRLEYSHLRFDRVSVENKFKKMRRAIADAFDGTGVDVDHLIKEYVIRENQFKKSLEEL